MNQNPLEPDDVASAVASWIGFVHGVNQKAAGEIAIAIRAFFARQPGGELLLEPLEDCSQIIIGDTVHAFPPLKRTSKPLKITRDSFEGHWRDKN